MAPRAASRPLAPRPSAGAGSRAASRPRGGDPDLPGRLCTRCGLCCDGSLFADVELAGAAEAARLEAMGLEVEDDDGGLLALPCGALRGRRCGIYRHRPECCRTFECRLLRDVRRGELGEAEAARVIAATVRRARSLRERAAALSPADRGLPLRELCLEALSREKGRAGRAGLEAKLAALDESIRARFL